MIKVSKMADYAVLVLHHLGSDTAQHSSRHNVESLASATGLASTTVRKLTNLLAGAGLVVARRGVNGGYELARPIEQIRLVDAITAIEGPVQLTACCNDEPSCDLLQSCHLRSKWPSINDLVINALANITVADFAPHAQTAADPVPLVPTPLTR